MNPNTPPLSTILEALRVGGVRILIILVAALVAIRVSTLIVHGVLKALLDREATEGTAQELSAVEVKKRMDTLDELGGRVVRFFVLLIAAIMILGALDLDIGPAIAGLGIVGIAVGFGAQSLVRDYLNGTLILIENQYSKGDVVSIAGVSGAVEDFSLRRTTLRDLDGVVHTVPNGAVIVASNRTRTWARINQNLTVAFGTDIATAIAVVTERGRVRGTKTVGWRRRRPVESTPPATARTSSGSTSYPTSGFVSSGTASPASHSSGYSNSRAASCWSGAWTTDGWPITGTEQAGSSSGSTGPRPVPTTA